MEIDWDSLIKFGVIAACCILGVGAVASAIYIFHYASAQTKPTGKNSGMHFALSWLLITAVVLFGVMSVSYVVKYGKKQSDDLSIVKALRSAAKKPPFNQ